MRLHAPEFGRTRSRQGLLVVLSSLMAVFGLAACSLMPPADFPRVDHVSLERYMGPWYVIATIPPGQTKNAYDALECYAQVEPGTIATTFTYREGGFNGEPHTMTPTGYVIDGTGNAIWGMQIFWPIELQYVIAYLDEDYRTVIVARSDRDYAWIMARTPKIPASTYSDLVGRVAALGYDMSKLRRMPQQPLDQRDDGCPRVTG